MAEYIEKTALVDMIKRTQGYDVEIADDLIEKDVAPIIHARWIEESSLYVFCSNCRMIEHHRDKIFKSEYCPNCGAKMD